MACTPDEVLAISVFEPFASAIVAGAALLGKRVRLVSVVMTAFARHYLPSGELVCLDGATVGACRRDESGFTPVRSCAEGSPCVEGRCESSCNPAGKVPSNVG